MRGELIKLHKRLGTTIVYVTHDQVEAMTMGELVVVMKDGVVQQFGAPLEIYRQPRNIFVAEFIGSPAMNFLEGRIEIDSGQIIVGDQVMRISIAQVGIGAMKLPVNRQIVVGIRPEHLAIESEIQQESEAIAIEGMVEVVEPLGAETIMEVNCRGSSLLARIKGDTLPPVGKNIRLIAEVNRFYFFDQTSGNRIS